MSQPTITQAERNKQRDVLPLRLERSESAGVYGWRLCAFLINFAGAAILYGVALIATHIRDSEHPILMLIAMFAGLALLVFIGNAVMNAAKESLKDRLPWEVGVALWPIVALYGLLVIVPLFILGGLFVYSS